MDSPPTSDVCHLAVVKAAAARRKRAQQDPRFSAFTPSAFVERINGLAAPPRLMRDGWWLVGHVMDEFADGDPEIEVWYHAPDDTADRRLRLVQRTWPDPPKAPKVTTRFCEERRIWVDAKTGEPVNDGVLPYRW